MCTTRSSSSAHYTLLFSSETVTSETSLSSTISFSLTLVVSAQQVRIHDCVGLKLFVRGAVILEQCREVEVGPYRVEGEADGDESWRQVKDFDFLGQGQSPNWRPLDQSEWRSFSLFSG